MAVFEEAPQFDWVMKYHEDDVVRFTVWDNVKRSHGEFFSQSINVFLSMWNLIPDFENRDQIKFKPTNCRKFELSAGIFMVNTKS